MQERETENRYVLVCTHMCRPEIPCAFFYWFPPHSLETGSLIEPADHLSLAGWPENPSTHLSPSLRASITGSHSHAQLLMSSEDSNSDPHACKCSYPLSISLARQKLCFFFFTRKRSGVQWLAFRGEATTFVGKKLTSIPLRKEKKINFDKLTFVTNTWISASITHSPWDMCSEGHTTV